MITDHPTKELFFVFAFTNCKIRVYEPDVDFARKILEIADVEILTEPPESSEEMDTRFLFDLFKNAFPKILDVAFPEKKDLIEKTLKELALGRNTH